MMFSSHIIQEVYNQMYALIDIPSHTKNEIRIIVQEILEVRFIHAIIIPYSLVIIMGYKE